MPRNRDPLPTRKRLQSQPEEEVLGYELVGVAGLDRTRARLQGRPDQVKTVLDPHGRLLVQDDGDSRGQPDHWTVHSALE